MAMAPWPKMMVSGWTASRSGMTRASSGEPLGTANQSTGMAAPRWVRASGSTGTKSGGRHGFGASSSVARMRSLRWACIDARTPGRARMRAWMSVSEEAL